MVEGKLFLQIRIINIVYPIMENMIVVTITKRMEIIICIHVCLNSRMNFVYMEKGGKKAFPANPKHQYRVSHYRVQNFNANNKKNGDYFEYQSLSHFTDELLL